MRLRHYLSMSRVMIASVVIALAAFASGCGEDERQAPIGAANSNQSAVQAVAKLYEQNPKASKQSVQKVLANYQDRNGLVVAKQISRDSILVCQTQGPYVNCSLNLFPGDYQSIVIADSASQAEKQAKSDLAQLRRKQNQDEKLQAGPAE